MKKNIRDKVVVVGGAGFIGSHLVDELVRDGLNVHVVDNLSQGKKSNVHPRAKLHVMDIIDLPSIAPVFKNAKYVFPTVSLRYFNVYGERQSSEGAYALVIAKFLAQKKQGVPLTITGTGKQTRDFTHVRDVVRANILAAKSRKTGRGEVINIGGG